MSSPTYVPLIHSSPPTIASSRTNLPHLLPFFPSQSSNLSLPQQSHLPTLPIRSQTPRSDPSNHTSQNPSTPQNLQGFFCTVLRLNECDHIQVPPYSFDGFPCSEERDGKALFVLRLDSIESIIVWRLRRRWPARQARRGWYLHLYLSARFEIGAQIADRSVGDQYVESLVIFCTCFKASVMEFSSVIFRCSADKKALISPAIS